MGAPLGRNSNNFAELYAIGTCLKELLQLPPSSSPIPHIFIFTDSLYASQSIISTKPPATNSAIILELRALYVSVTRLAPTSFHWIRGHCGAGGNERVDRIAKSYAKLSRTVRLVFALLLISCLFYFSLAPSSPFSPYCPSSTLPYAPPSAFHPSFYFFFSFPRSCPCSAPFPSSTSHSWLCEGLRSGCAASLAPCRHCQLYSTSQMYEFEKHCDQCASTHAASSFSCCHFPAAAA